MTEDKELKWFAHAFRVWEEMKVKQVMETRVEEIMRRRMSRNKWKGTTEMVDQQEVKNYPGKVKNV